MICYYTWTCQGNWHKNMSVTVLWWSAFLDKHLQGSVNIWSLSSNYQEDMQAYEIIYWALNVYTENYGTMIVNVSQCHIYNSIVCKWLRGVPMGFLLGRGIAPLMEVIVLLWSWGSHTWPPDLPSLWILAQAIILSSTLHLKQSFRIIYNFAYHCCHIYM